MESKLVEWKKERETLEKEIKNLELLNFSALEENIELKILNSRIEGYAEGYKNGYGQRIQDEKNKIIILP